MAIFGIPNNLRQKILDATSDIIGIYTFSNGQTISALAVDDNGKFPPAGTQVQGLEIVIIPAVNSTTRPLLQAILWEHKSRIILKQWDLTGDTLNATSRIVPLLGNQVQVGPRILPNESIGNIESRTITFSYTEITENNYGITR